MSTMNETMYERCCKVMPAAANRATKLGIVRGEGSYIYTDDGRKILDFASGVAVNNLGKWEDGVRNKEVLLGDIINAKPPVAVCRHRSLLSKILGDEVGLHIELQRGNWYENGNPNNYGGGHAWNVVRFDDGTSAIYDAMHDKIANTTSGHVDPMADEYLTVNNEKLYGNSNVQGSNNRVN